MEANGVLGAVYDEANRALRVTQADAAEFVGYAQVLTSETTTSTTFTDLTTVGPSVTVTVPAGKVWDLIVEFDSAMGNSGSGSSRATVLLDAESASTDHSAAVQGTNTVTSGSNRYIESLAAGAHTIKLVYLASSGTATFTRRKLRVTRVAERAA